MATSAKKPSGPPIIRMGHPMAFAAFLRHNGAQYEDCLERHGLPVCCQDPNAFVLLRQAWAFFDTTARRLDPMLAWHVGQFVGDHNLNRAFLKRLEHAPTLYQALKQFVWMRSAEASHLQLGMRERRDDIVLFTHYPNMKGWPGYHASQAYQLGVILGVIRHFCGGNWMPEEVGIEFPIVPAAAEEIFPGARILAHQRTGYMTIPRSCLHLAPPRGDSDEAEEGPLVLTRGFEYVDTLRVLLRPYLPQGYPNMSLGASLMDTSVRTLDRRLSDAGLRYRAVIDRIRFEEARKLLEGTDASITEVGAAVGFDDSANFSRMFHRISGLSPRQFRKEAVKGRS